jgi:transposase
MLIFSSHHQYYIYTKIVDMRKGIDGLAGIVANEMQGIATDGNVYVFFNATRDKIKLLIWDHDGYVLYLKRLERGRFEQIIFKDENDNKYKIQFNHLVMLMSGISLVGMKQKLRYKLQNSA